MRGVVVGIFVVCVALATEQKGHACTCEVVAPIVSPRDGATNVPRNAIVIASFRHTNQPVLELRHVASGELVELVWTTHPSGRFGIFTVFARPVQTLLQGATYEVRAAAQAGYQEALWRFTVGDSIDTAPPSFTGIRGAVFETMQYAFGCVSSCVDARDGHVSRIRLEYDEVPSDAVYLELELRTLEGQPLARVPVPGVDVLGSTFCEPRSPVLEPGAWYCARMIAYDIAGHAAGGTELFCGDAIACPPALKEGGFCEPSELCEAPPPPPPGLAPTGGCNAARSTSWSLALLALALALARRSARTRRHRDRTQTPSEPCLMQVGPTGPRSDPRRQQHRAAA